MYRSAHSNSPAYNKRLWWVEAIETDNCCFVNVNFIMIMINFVLISYVIRKF